LKERGIIRDGGERRTHFKGSLLHVFVRGKVEIPHPTGKGSLNYKWAKKGGGI